MEDYISWKDEVLKILKMYRINPTRHLKRTESQYLECWNNKLTPVNAVINIIKKDHKLINDMNKLQKRKETIKKILK